MTDFVYQQTITNEEIKALPPVVFNGEIELVEDFHGQNVAAHYLSEHNIIGVDTESRASFQKGVVNNIALLQLSAGNKAFLIRLNKVKLSKSILDLLESEDYIKVGVALRDDIKEVNSVSQFQPKRFVDLQKIVADYGIKDISLQKMVGIILGNHLSKAQRLSNWEAVNLTPSQKEYAAIDAWVCVELFNKLGLNNEQIEKANPITNSKSKKSEQDTIAVNDSIKNKKERKKKYWQNRYKKKTKKTIVNTEENL